MNCPDRNGYGMAGIYCRAHARVDARSERTMVRRFLTGNFRMDDIDSWTGKDYLHRWWLASVSRWRAYLHCYIASDPILDLHDHPRWFLSIGLRGGYVEEVGLVMNRGIDGRERIVRRRRQFRAPWIRWFGPSHTHRVRINRARPCWTLVIAGPSSGRWGWWSGPDHAPVYRDWRDPELMAERAGRGRGEGAAP